MPYIVCSKNLIFNSKTNIFGICNFFGYQIIRNLRQVIIQMSPVFVRFEYGIAF